MPQRKKKSQPSSKQRAKSGKQWQSAILRRVLSHVRPALAEAQSHEVADAIRAVLSGEAAQTE